MEPNQAVNPSSEASGIPQGIPTGVFVANNQVPAQTPTVEAPVTQSQAPVVPVSVPVSPVPVPTAQATEGALDKVFTWLARFFAKIMWQPDPITGLPAATSPALQKWQNIVGKMRGAANQVVEKATDVANQAAQQVQQIIPPPVATPTPTPVAAPAPVQEAPVAPVQSAPVVEQPVSPTPTV